MQSRWRANRVRRRCFARPKCWEGWRAGWEPCRAKRGGGATWIEPTTPCTGGIGVGANRGDRDQTGERGPRASGGGMGGGEASGRDRDASGGGPESRGEKCKDCWAPCCRRASSCCAEDRERDCCWASSETGCAASVRQRHEWRGEDETWSRRAAKRRARTRRRSRCRADGRRERSEASARRCWARWMRWMPSRLRRDASHAGSSGRGWEADGCRCRRCARGARDRIQPRVDLMRGGRGWQKRCGRCTCGGSPRASTQGE